MTPGEGLQTPRALEGIKRPSRAQNLERADDNIMDAPITPQTANQNAWTIVRYRTPDGRASTILAQRPGALTRLPANVQYAGLPTLRPVDARAGDETDFSLAVQAMHTDGGTAYFETLPRVPLEGIAFSGRILITPDLARRVIAKEVSFDEYMRLAWQAGANDMGEFEVA